MTYFYRAGGGHGPLGPPESATVVIVIPGGLWFFWNRNGNDDRKKWVEDPFLKYFYSTIQEYTVAIATVIEHNASYGTLLKLFIRTKISSQT